MRIIVNLYTTWNCNFRCAHCIHECGPEVKDHMSIEQIDRAFNFIEWCQSHNHQVVVVGLTGGEPTLNPHFWTHIMPKAEDAKSRIKVDNWEIHTNASVPVSPAMIFQYSKFFNKIWVGHDPFHRKFKSLAELRLGDYTQLTTELVLRYNEHKCINSVGQSEMLSVLRRKGRAAQSLSNGNLIDVSMANPKEIDCSVKKYAYDNPAADFTPWHINHCGEHSHPQPIETNHGQFLPYNTSNDDILASAIRYISHHCAEKCTQPCYKALGKLSIPPFTPPVLVNQTEEKVLA